MEMLVGVILISLLIGVAIFSFRHQLITIQKTQKVGINSVITYNQLRTSLQSIKYYVVDDYDTLNYPMQNLHLFFSGTTNEMHYITNSPLFSNEIALVKLECLESNLLYHEEPLYGRIDFLRPELKEDSKKTALYENLEKCEFNYFKKDIKLSALQNDIPTAIVIDLTSKEILNRVYVNVQSDYNQSVGIVNEAIYPVD